MKNFDAKCVQGAYNPKNGEPRVLPLFQSTTYVYDSPEYLAKLFDLSAEGHIYSRISNPTLDCFEKKATMLENGTGAMACSSGMSAIMLSVLNVAFTGDNILTSSQIYGGTYNLFTYTFPKYGINPRIFDIDDKAEDIEKLIDAKTKVIFFESVANPGMAVADFDKLVNIAKKHKVLLICDNTLTTPYICRPIDLGVNVVVHSTTKYMDGHAQAVGGLVIDGGNFDFNQAQDRYPELCKNDESYHGLNYARDCGGAAFVTKLRVQMIRDTGAIMSPMNAWLTNLGLETLHLRMDRHSQNGLAAAKALLTHKNVEWVRYPGLEGDKYFETAKKYFINGNCSGMVVFGIKGGREEANNFIRALKNIKNVTHIADSRSCVLHPATTTHRQLSEEGLKNCGITDNLVRLSVGIENQEYIIEDLMSALDSLN